MFLYCAYGVIQVGQLELILLIPLEYCNITCYYPNIIIGDFHLFDCQALDDIRIVSPPFPDQYDT